MFTGIIESLGTITHLSHNGTNQTFWIASPLSHTFKPDQSVSHNGVCLTIEEVNENSHRVTAISETLKKTNLGQWKEGTTINLERCLALNGRLDGHFVQGHVDGTGTCISKEEKNGSWEFEIKFDESFAPLMIEKGSICIEGISLTAFEVTRNSFKVAIIPFTYDHTNIGKVEVGHTVNLEFDLLGKYISRNLSLSAS